MTIFHVLDLLEINFYIVMSPCNCYLIALNNIQKRKITRFSSIFNK